MKLAAGIALCVLAVAGFVVFLVTSLRGAMGPVARLALPSVTTARLEAGDYTVYWESDGALLAAAPPPLMLKARPASGGPEIDAVPTSAFFVRKYSTGSRIGLSVLSLSIPATGDYELVTAVTFGKTPASAVLQISPGFGVLRLFGIVFGSLAILGAGLGLGIPLIIRSVRPRAA